MAANAVTDNATGAVLKYGYTDFIGDYDPATQTIVALAEESLPVTGVPLYYQKIVSGLFVEMTDAEKEAVDAAGISPTLPSEWVSAGSAIKVGTDNYDCFYSSFSSKGNLTTGAIVAGTLYALPLITPLDLRIDRIGINVTTGATGSARLGIYKNRLGYPKKLAYDAGEVDVSATGQVKITGNKKLRQGMNWLVILSNAAPTIRCFNPANIDSPLGYASNLPNSPQFGFTVAQTYGALPDQFPAFAGATIITAAPIPAVFVRYDKFV